MIDPCFQGVNRLFVLSFENENDRKVHTKVEIKDYNVMIDGKNVFDQSVKSDMRTYDNIRKIATDQGDDHTTGCSLDYNCFNKHYKMIALDFSKHQALNTDPKAIQAINFTGNLDRAAGVTMSFITEEAKEINLDFTQAAVKVL